MFAGLLCRQGGDVPARFVHSDLMASSLSPPAPPGAETRGSYLLLRSTSTAHPLAPQREGEDVAVLWGTIHDKPALARELDGAPEISEAEIVLRAYRQWGDGFASHLGGEYAGAVYDAGARRVLLFRDPVGTKPLYYRSTRDFFAFSTTTRSFSALHSVSHEPDPTWIAFYLAGIVPGHAATGWKDVHKVPPGHVVAVTSQKVTVSPWHRWRNDPPWATERHEHWVDAYRAALVRSVRRRLAPARIGVECSGGIDSSAVTALVAEEMADHRNAITAFGYDIMQRDAGFIALVCARAGIDDLHLLERPRPDVDDVATVIKAVGYPEIDANALGVLPILRECRAGDIGSLFSGFGGDEAVSNSGALLARELRDHRAFRLLWHQLPGSPLPHALRFAKALALGRRWTNVSSLQVAMEARWPSVLVRSDVADSFGVTDAYRSTALYDRPFRRINDFVVDNRLPTVASRLESTTLTAAMFGVEYRWPLLDVDLIQQYLDTPSIEKSSPGSNRFLHRRAVADVLPAPVIRNPTKDMGGPRSGSDDGAAASAHHIALVRRMLQDPPPALTEVLDIARARSQLLDAERGVQAAAAAYQFTLNSSLLTSLTVWLRPELVEQLSAIGLRSPGPP